MLHKLGVTQYLAHFIAATRWDDIPAAASMITCAGSGEPIPVWAARLAFPDLFCIAGGGLCDGFRMTAHLRRCHEHRGRRPKAAKEGKRGEWGTRLSGRYGGFGWGRRCGGRPLGVDRLNKEVNAGLGDPKFKARLADFGGTALSGSPADFGRIMAEETEKWGKVVKFSGAKAD
jgi:hypothetical protein